jgi:hypothetical protein
MKKLTYEFVKSKFEEEGYELLSTEYKNNYTKLDYICPNNHEHSITWHDWQGGKRCPYCYGNKKLTIDTIRKKFEDEGYTLLSTEYINNKTPLEYICPNGHKGSIIWNSWVIGTRCPFCYGNNTSTIEDIEFELKKRNYKLLGGKYVNSKTKIKCICDFGHIHYNSLTNLKQGCWCPVCLKIKKFGEGNPNWQGGVSNDDYFEVWKDQEYKQDIRERDGNKCLNPYCYGNDEVLSIHHIDYNKQDCHPSNLITVCRSCNSRANKDRKWHKAWYQAIMHIRYNYIY